MAGAWSGAVETVDQTLLWPTVSSTPRTPIVHGRSRVWLHAWLQLRPDLSRRPRSCRIEGERGPGQGSKIAKRRRQAPLTQVRWPETDREEDGGGG
jgi:hypothetical protein